MKKLILLILLVGLMACSMLKVSPDFDYEPVHVGEEITFTSGVNQTVLFKFDEPVSLETIESSDNAVVNTFSVDGMHVDLPSENILYISVYTRYEKYVTIVPVSQEKQNK